MRYGIPRNPICFDPAIKAVVFWLFAIQLPLCPFAQSYIDLAKVGVSDTPQNDFDTSDASTRLTEMSLELTFPKPINDRLVWINGINYEGIQASVFPGIDPVTVHGVMFRTGFSVVHGESLKGNYFILPKLSSDFKSIGRRDFQIGALALFRKTKSPNFIWQYGALFNTELFGPFVVPLLGFYYFSPSEKLEMNFLLPASADMNYRVGKSLCAGIQFNSMVKSFHLNNRTENNKSSYWVKSTNEIFAYLQFQPIRSLLIQFRIGHSVARRYSAYETDDKIDLGIMAFKIGDDRTRLNPYFADGLIWQMRLAYRLHLNDK